MRKPFAREPACDTPVHLQRADVFAVEQDRTRVRRQCTRQQIHQRTLAGAVRADQGMQLAGLDLQIGTVNGCDASEVLMQAMRLQLRAAIQRASRKALPRYHAQRDATSELRSDPARAKPRGANKTTPSKIMPRASCQCSVCAESNSSSSNKKTAPMAPPKR